MRIWLIVASWSHFIHIFFLAYFVSGFFLTRFELSDVSHGESRNYLAETNLTNSVTETCVKKAKYDKIVMFIIDALRIDFVQPYNYSTSGSTSDRSRYFSNRFTNVKKCLNATPELCRLFVFNADAPTVTTQRLKGLTAGSIPTFIDISDSFDRSSISEDNIIQQWVNSGKRLIMMGDDTWMSLFPALFAESYPFPSFDTRDLDTVDNGIMGKINSVMKNDSAWDLLIVDHIGHTYTPYHPIMLERLDKMNELLDWIMVNLPPRTLLVMFGDHGMSDSGNHGGSSDEETHAGLFVYASDPPLFSSSEVITWNDSFLKYQSASVDDVVYSSRLVDQVDIVPSLSLLTGTNIPFSNLGSIIPELFWEADSLSLVIRALHQNARQVMNFFEVYFSRQSTLPKSSIDPLRSTYSHAMDLFRDKWQDNSYHEQIAGEFRRFLKQSLEFGRSLWSEFNLPTLIISLTGMTCMLIIGWINSFSYLTAISESVAQDDYGGQIAYPIYSAMNSVLDLLEPVNAADASQSSSIQFLSRYAGLLFVLLGLSFFSNSFIVAEKKVLYFLVQSFMLSMIVACLIDGSISHNKSKRNKFVVSSVVAMILVRIAFFMQDRLHGMAPKTSFSISLTILPSIYIMKLVCDHFLTRKVDSKDRFRVKCLLVLLNLYWWLEYHKDGASDGLLRLYSARLVLVGCALGIMACIVRICKSDVQAFKSLLAYWIVLQLITTGAAAPLTYALLIQSSIIARENLIGVGWSSSPHVLAACALFLFLLGRLANLCTSHSTYQFSDVQLMVGFVGFDHFYRIPAGILLFINTFGNDILWSLLSISRFSSNKPIVSVISLQSSISLYLSTCCALSAFVLRRHLMVWAIFAPKFVFESLFAFSNFVWHVVILKAVVSE